MNTGPTFTIPQELPLEYSIERPDHRSPLMEVGESWGVFVNPLLAAQTREFLTLFPNRSTEGNRVDGGLRR